MSLLNAVPKPLLLTLSTLVFLIITPVHAQIDCKALQSNYVYQIINPKTNINLLTSNKTEAENASKYGFTNDRGAIFYASKKPAKGLVPIHRLYDPKTGYYFWTANQNEVASATQKYGYKDQGVNFFAATEPATCTQPVYRYLKGNLRRHAISQHDIKALEATGWRREAIGFYAAPPLPELGINLGGAKDWSSEWFFTDLMKVARPFASISVAWDGLNNPIAVDANGWPIGDAGTLVMAVNDKRPEVRPHLSGTYTLSFKGLATSKMKVKANNKPLTVRSDATKQNHTADVVYDNNNNLFFTFEGIQGGAKDIYLVHKENKSSDTFNPLFLQRIKTNDDLFGIIRPMETTATNGNKIALWGDRTQKNHATQQRQFQNRDAGMAWEYVIELSNQTGKDLWVNIPHQASDTYISQLAFLLKHTLNSNRKIYLEYSNEIWNEMVSNNFKQRWDVSKAACDKVLINGDPDKYYQGLTGNKNDCRTQKVGAKTSLEYIFMSRHSAWKLKRASDIFKEVFGEEAMLTRVRPMLAWDVWNIGISTPRKGSLEDQLAYLNKNFGNPSQYIYGVAISAYISMSNKPGETEHPYNLLLSVDEMFDRMKLYNENVLLRQFKESRTVADQYNLKMFAYEGGPGFFANDSKSEIVKNMRAVHTDPRLKNLIKDLFNNWKKSGGDTFIYYNLVGTYSGHTLFGLSERLEDDNSVKWQALKEIITEWRQ